jgi:hypothetical protein
MLAVSFDQVSDGMIQRHTFPEAFGLRNASAFCSA